MNLPEPHPTAPGAAHFYKTIDPGATDVPRCLVAGAPGGRRSEKNLGRYQVGTLISRYQG